MSVNHICFISEGYPTEDYPFFTFVRQLVCAIADKGIKCSVISPQSVTKNIIRKKKKRPSHWIDLSPKGYEIDIYQPNCISVGNISIRDINMSHYFFERSAIRVFKKMNLKPDILYGHFWHCGIIGAKMQEEWNVPVIVATGEAFIKVHTMYPKTALEKYVNRIDGVIAVSSKNREESIGLDLVDKNNITVIPNAIDNKKFYLLSKNQMRKELGYLEEDFIVAFTGSFIHRKGAKRVAEAINQLDGVKSIYIGAGEDKPEGDDILFCGTLPHNDVAKYLNAADVFVLPTLAEGCCNAIIEAMACGLPIISSNLTFNDDILSDENSIRVDSMNIDEIADAIKNIKSDIKNRNMMSNASIEIAKELQIENRAERVVEFIEKYGG